MQDRSQPVPAALVAAGVAGIAAAAVLAGWSSGLPILASWLPGRMVMLPWTATVVALLAASLAADVLGWRRLCNVGTALAMGLSGAFLASQLFDLGPTRLDGLLFPEALRAVRPDLTGRMGLVSATATLLLSVALRLSPRQAWHYAPALVAATLGYVAAAGHLYDATMDEMEGEGASPPLPLALALLALATGILCRRADAPLPALLASGTTAGRAGRMLLPAAVMLPLVFGFMQLAGESAGAFHRAEGSAIRTSLQAIVQTGVVWIALSIIAKSQVALARQEQHLETTLSSIGDGVIATDTAGHVTRMNHAAEQLTGWDQSSARGRPVADVFRVDEAPGVPSVQRLADDVLHKGATARAAERTVMLTRMGARRAVAHSLAPIRRPGHDVEGAVLVFRDVTAQRERERQLKLYASLLDHLRDPVIALDNDRRVTAWNHAAQALYGWSRKEAVGRPIDDLLNPSRADAARDEPADLEPGSPLRRYLRRRDGSPVTVECLSEAIVDATGRVVGEVSVHRDVTERDRLTAQLQQAERVAMLGTLAASVGHEINNPLSFVTGNLELLAEQLQGEPGTMAAEALEGADRIRRVVQDLKMLSRSDDAHVPVDLREVVHGAVAMAGNELRHRALLELQLGDVPSVLASPSRLAQVVLNLVLNAAQSIEEGGVGENLVQITTATTPSGDAELVISDTGCGIPAENLARVFEPFFTTKPIGFGTGLGLSVSHGIVTALGGTIDIDSQVGKGTTVRVTLPAHRAGSPS